MLFQLQYVRAVAALMVVYFHSVLQLRNIGETGSAFPLVGECGVDLFFLLSGFVMWLTTAGKPVETFGFYGRRIIRIVPLYWGVTIAAAVIALAMPSLLKSTRFDLPHILASLFFIPWPNPAIGDGSQIMPLVVPGWTLNYEMYFYLIFGVLLVVPQERRALWLAAVLAAVTAVCHLLPVSTASRFYGDPIVLEFLAGVLLADAYLKHRLLPRALALAGLPLGLCFMLLADYLDLEAWRALSFGLPALLALWSALSLDWQKIGEWRWLSALGDASYSLYLTHVFVLAGARVLFLRLPEGMRSQPLFLLLAVAMSVVVALAVHRLFERPIDRYLRKGMTKPRPALKAVA